MRLHAPQLDAALERLAGGEHADQNVTQSGVAGEIEQRHTLRHRHARTDDASKGIVAEGDAQFLIHGQHALHHGGENGLAAGAFHFQFVDQVPDFGGGLLEREGQGAEAIVAAGQLVVGEGGIGQAFDVGAEALDAARKGAHELRGEAEGEHQAEQREAEQPDFQLVPVGVDVSQRGAEPQDARRDFRAAGEPQRRAFRHCPFGEWMCHGRRQRRRALRVLRRGRLAQGSRSNRRGRLPGIEERYLRAGAFRGALHPGGCGIHGFARENAEFGIQLGLNTVHPAAPRRPDHVGVGYEQRQEQKEKSAPEVSAKDTVAHRIAKVIQSRNLIIAKARENGVTEPDDPGGGQSGEHGRIVAWAGGGCGGFGGLAREVLAA